MRVLAAIGILAILAVIGAAVFFFGGFYSIAANESDPGAVSWALEKIRDASIDHRAHFAAPANLDDAEWCRPGRGPSHNGDAQSATAHLV